MPALPPGPDAEAPHRAVRRQLADLRPGRPVVVCSECSAPTGSEASPTVVLGCCLAEVPLHRVVDLWAARRRLGVDLSCCTRPSDARAHLGALAWLADFDLDASLAPGRFVLAVARPPVSRRGLLGLGRTPHAVQPTAPSRTPPLPLWAAGATRPAQARLSSSRPVSSSAVCSGSGGVRLGAVGCTACGVCVRACPHEALTLTVSGGVATLAHLRARCRGERRCLDLCPERALSDGGPLDLRDAAGAVALATLAVRACARCGATIPAGGEALCRVCRARRAKPLGSALPPELDRRLRRPTGP